MIEVASRMHSKEFVPAMVNDLLRLLDTKLFETKTVKELIGGYKDPLMALAKMFEPELIKDDEFSIVNGVTSIFVFLVRLFVSCFKLKYIYIEKRN